MLDDRFGVLETSKIFVNRRFSETQNKNPLLLNPNLNLECNFVDFQFFSSFLSTKLNLVRTKQADANQSMRVSFWHVLVLSRACVKLVQKLTTAARGFCNKITTSLKLMQTLKLSRGFYLCSSYNWRYSIIHFYCSWLYMETQHYCLRRPLTAIYQSISGKKKKLSLKMPKSKTATFSQSWFPERWNAWNKGRTTKMFSHLGRRFWTAESIGEDLNRLWRLVSELWHHELWTRGFVECFFRYFFSMKKELNKGIGVNLNCLEKFSTKFWRKGFTEFHQFSKVLRFELTGIVDFEPVSWLVKVWKLYLIIFSNYDVAKFERFSENVLFTTFMCPVGLCSKFKNRLIFQQFFKVV